ARCAAREKEEPADPFTPADRQDEAPPARVRGLARSERCGGGAVHGYGHEQVPRSLPDEERGALERERAHQQLYERFDGRRALGLVVLPPRPPSSSHRPRFPRMQPGPPDRCANLFTFYAPGAIGSQFARGERVASHTGGSTPDRRSRAPSRQRSRPTLSRSW